MSYMYAISKRTRLKIKIGRNIKILFNKSVITRSKNCELNLAECHHKSKDTKVLTRLVQFIRNAFAKVEILMQFMTFAKNMGYVIQWRLDNFNSTVAFQELNITE